MRGHREWRLPPRRVPRSRRILRGFRVATQGLRCPPRLANADVLARMATSDLARDLVRGGLPFCLRKVVPRPPPGGPPAGSPLLGTASEAPCVPGRSWGICSARSRGQFPSDFSKQHGFRELRVTRDRERTAGGGGVRYTSQSASPLG